MGWQEDLKLITQGYTSAINENNLELYKVIKENLESLNDILPIVDFILDRIHSVLDLLQAGKLWDAEIILRTATETLVKLLFITSSKDEEQRKLLNEFWDDLAEVSRIKQSEQAKKNLEFFGNNEVHRLANSPNVLSPEEENRLRGRWNKKDRRKLEQKWSFSELVLKLAVSYKDRELKQIVTLLHPYRMASHVAHGDETGILIIRERMSRTQEERIIANFSHHSRIVSDCYYYSRLTAYSVLDYLGLETNIFIDEPTSLFELKTLSDTYAMRIYDDELYDNFRNQDSID